MPQESSEVVDRPTALASEAIPAALRLVVDMQAGRLIVMKWAARLVVSSDGPSGQAFDVLTWGDVEERIAVGGRGTSSHWS